MINRAQLLGLVRRSRRLMHLLFFVRLVHALEPWDFIPANVGAGNGVHNLSDEWEPCKPCHDLRDLLLQSSYYMEPEQAKGAVGAFQRKRDGYRALFALRDMEPGVTLFNFHHSGLPFQQAMPMKLAVEISKSSERLGLSLNNQEIAEHAAFIIATRRGAKLRGELALLADAYIKVMPSEVPEDWRRVLLNESEIEQLRATNKKNPVLDKHLAAMSNIHQAAKLLLSLSWETLVSSQGRKYSAADDLQSEIYQTLMLLMARRYGKSILPWADFMNHYHDVSDTLYATWTLIMSSPDLAPGQRSTNKQVVGTPIRISHEPHDENFTCFTQRFVHAGEELVLSYNDMSAFDAMLYYGFVPEVRALVRVEGAMLNPSSFKDCPLDKALCDFCDVFATAQNKEQRGTLIEVFDNTSWKLGVYPPIFSCFEHATDSAELADFIGGKCREERVAWESLAQLGKVSKTLSADMIQRLQKCEQDAIAFGDEL